MAPQYLEIVHHTSHAIRKWFHYMALLALIHLDELLAIHQIQIYIEIHHSLAIQLHQFLFQIDIKGYLQRGMN